MYYRPKRTRKAKKARNKEEKCATKWCKNRRAAKKTRYKMANGSIKVYEVFLNHCWKCRSKMAKNRRPVSYILNAIRNRAKQRKIPFTVTLAEFKKFCEDTQYIEKRGHFEGGLSIDRKDHSKGYHIWNIKVTEFLENCTNGHTIPGQECPQNERKPAEYSYDFNGPEAANGHAIPGQEKADECDFDESELPPVAPEPIQNGDPF